MHTDVNIHSNCVFAELRNEEQTAKFRKTHLGAKNKLRFSVLQEPTAAISTASLQNIILQMSVVRLWCSQYTEYQGLITRALNIGFQ